MKPLNRITLVLVVMILHMFTLNAQTTRYVSLSGSNAGGNQCDDPDSPCRTIGFATNAAVPGDIISIGGGVYTESLSIEKSVSIHGAGTGVTTIQAHLQAGEASGSVILIFDGLNVEISDLTIRHGNAVGQSFEANRGGGINTRANSLALNNVHFINNNASDFGGGIFNNGGTLDLSDVLFENNSAERGAGLYNSGGEMTIHATGFVGNAAAESGGGLYSVNSNTALIDVLFIENTALIGAGMYNQNDSPLLEKVSFIENRAEHPFAGTFGGGLYSASGSPVLKNVIFSGNIATSVEDGGFGGGLYAASGSPELVNVFFTGNSADNNGGAILNVGSTPVLTNVTFTENEAINGNGGGMYNDGSFVEITNSIFWNNTANNGNQIYNSANSSLIIGYSLYSNASNDIEEGAGFTPNNELTVDPLFTDPENGDFTLQDGSPAINAGDPGTDPSVFPVGENNEPIDLAGNTRFDNGTIDIGAYEFQSEPEPEIPDPPELVVPADGTRNLPVSVRLEWQGVKGAEAYRVQVTHADAGFRSPVFDESIVRTSVFVDNLDESTEYQWRVRALSQDGDSDWSREWNFTTGVQTSVENIAGIPDEYSLSQNYPNPFNPATTIRFGLPEKTVVSLSVYDVTGRHITTIVNNERLQPGEYSVVFHAGNLPSGAYLYRLQTDKHVETRHLLLVR